MSDDHYKNLFTNESIAMTERNNMSTKDHWTFIAGSLIELAGERDDLNTLADSQRELIDSLNNENDSLKQELTRTQGHLDDMTVENARLEEENQALRRGQGRWPKTPTVPRFINQNGLKEGQEVGFIGGMNTVVGRIAFIEEGEVRLERGEHWLLSEDDTIVLLNEAPTGADKVRASRPGTVWIDNTGQHWQWDGEKVSVRFGRDKEYLGGAVEVWDANWTRVPDMEPI